MIESADAIDRARRAWAFSRAGIRSLDRAAIEEYGIPGIVLMENAARALAAQALSMLAFAAPDSHTLVFCGSGNNGGDGYALARHLQNAGASVALVCLGEPRPATDAATNRDICRHMGVPEIALENVGRFAAANHVALVVDAIFGTGLDRPVTGPAADAITCINALRRPVLAVDIPSGMDADTGAALGCAVVAACTVTLVGPKLGFAAFEAQKLLGRVVIGDIGAPVELLERFGQPVSLNYPGPSPHEFEAASPDSLD